MTRPLRYYVIFEMGRATHVVAGYADAYRAGSFRGFPSPTIAKHYADDWNKRAAIDRPHLFLRPAAPVEIIERDTPPRTGAQYEFAF